ncbi:glycosyltransferase family 25 protein [Mesorhizobium sp. Z1-4]|uniref:glycosyltransferase family 25 protein n=1 Tax=Mesorhizobium sp. Z1-4 TaxID=2448478 RepID=UPI000FD9C19B|nr:glycosyltransferase family 25 protein [Mesorhizobium sp. Z1-4]
MQHVTEPRNWPVLVISLKDDSDRRTRIKARLDALGIPFSFLDAIDGRSGLAEHFEVLVDRSAARERLKGREMTDAELACALSHRSAYEHILSSSVEGAVILEDDAHPTSRLRSFLDNRAFRRGDLMLLDHGQIIPWFGRWHRLPGGGIALPVGFKANYATGYSLSRRGAETLLEATTPVSMTADWPLDLRKLGALACLPRQVRRSNGHVEASHIEQSRKHSFAAWRQQR